MNDFLKATCIIIYLLAVGAVAGLLPPALGSAVQTVAVVLLGLHLVEVLVAFRSINRYPGALVDSIALTLLFGFLHWRSLATRA
ncbi:MAG: hypothetical protein V9E93_11160 [Steroidobacteraceae bacterium]